MFWKSKLELYFSFH